MSPGGFCSPQGSFGRHCKRSVSWRQTSVSDQRSHKEGINKTELVPEHWVAGFTGTVSHILRVPKPGLVTSLSVSRYFLHNQWCAGLSLCWLPTADCHTVRISTDWLLSTVII